MKEEEKQIVKKEIDKEEKRVIKKYTSEFKSFLNEYTIVGMAIGIIMGGATKELVNSLVKDIVMPFIVPVIPGESWREAAFSIGSITIQWGSFLSAIINFVILALIVFIIAKKVLKEEKVKKR